MAARSEDIHVMDYQIFSMARDIREKYIFLLTLENLREKIVRII